MTADADIDPTAVRTGATHSYQAFSLPPGGPGLDGLYLETVSAALAESGVGGTVGFERATCPDGVRSLLAGDDASSLMVRRRCPSANSALQVQVPGARRRPGRTAAAAVAAAAPATTPARVRADPAALDDGGAASRAALRPTSAGAADGRGDQARCRGPDIRDLLPASRPTPPAWAFLQPQLDGGPPTRRLRAVCGLPTSGAHAAETLRPGVILPASSPRACLP